MTEKITHLQDMKKLVENTKTSQELAKLYEQTKNRSTWKKEFQAELKAVVGKFDKKLFLDHITKDRTNTVLFQMANKENGYTKSIDGIAGEKSQTKQLAEKKFVELAKGESGLENKEKTEDYVKLDGKTKQALINLGLSSGKILEQLGAKDKVILEGKFKVKIGRFDTEVPELKLSYISPQDIVSINKEIRENRLLSKEGAQNYLNQKLGGKYILCHNCKQVEQYTDDNKYELSTKENGNISAEDFKKLPLGIERGLTIKSIKAFIDSATKKFPQLKDSKNVLLGSNKYDWYKGSPEIVSIIADPKDGGEPKKIFKLDISSLVPIPEVATHYT